MKINRFLRVMLCIVGSLPTLFACVDVVSEKEDIIETTTRVEHKDSDLFYYYFDEKVLLQEQSDEILVQLEPSVKKESLFSLINETTLSISSASFGEGGFNYVVFEDRGGKKISEEVIKAVKSRDDVISVSYMYQYDGWATQGLKNNFIVKLKPSTSYEQLQKLAESFNCIVGEEDEFCTKQYSLHVSKSSKFDAMQMANMFYETGLFEFSEPNFMIFATKNSNDPYFPRQWALKNTGQDDGISGIDINVEQAWAITKGNPNIKIAVIDDGIELTHPDLQFNLISGYDATGQNLSNTAGGALLADDTHGTSVAGIIGAQQNNIVNGVNEGISGVAPNCKIIPVRIWQGNITDATWQAKGINWSWQNGADVINISATFSPHASVTTAINNAIADGCIVVVSSGNKPSFSTVKYPANLPDVIAVGAVDRTGARATWPEVNQASNYGLGLDVVAPGDKIYTTDRIGDAGYNTSYSIMDIPNLNYTSLADGTSAAAPQVAGIAALILSVNPNLTRQQVVNAIEQSARKIGNISEYNINGSNGMWSNEKGYGLVDAFRAIVDATYPPLSAGTIRSDQTVLAGMRPDPLTNMSMGSGGYGQLTYKWYMSSNNSTWSEMSQTDPSQLSLSAFIHSGYHYYRRVVTDEAGRSASSNTITITILDPNQALDGGIISPGSQTIASGSRPSLLTSTRSAYGGSGTIYYQWHSAVAGPTINWTTITGATGLTYHPPVLTGSGTTMLYRRVATVGSLTASSNVVSISIQ